MIAPRHILGTFDEALASLRNNVLMMSSLTERSLDHAITGLLQRDDELCAIAIADDEEIDQLEKQVDKDGIDLLLRFQPVASDLRRVVSAMKLSSNLERMADQGTNIARRARKPIDRLNVVDISADRVRQFLSDLEEKRLCRIATRNQRLAAIHALARFVAVHAPELVEWCGQVRTVPYKKAPKH